MNLGDLVEVGQYVRHWNNWFSAAQDVIARIPEMPVQGNHETYVDVNEKATARPMYFTSQFHVFANGPEGLCGQAYSFDYGDAHFAVLDSQEDEEKDLAGSILPQQAAWLAGDLDHSTKTWKLVFFHKTPFYNKAVRPNEALKAAFCPVCESHGVDLVFNGHDHGLSRTYPIKNGRFWSQPGDGTVYYVTGRSGAKTYNDLTRKVWDAFFYDPQEQSCYLTVQIDGPRLTVRAFKTNGTLLDTLHHRQAEPLGQHDDPRPGAVQQDAGHRQRRLSPGPDAHCEVWLDGPGCAGDLVPRRPGLHDVPGRFRVAPGRRHLPVPGRQELRRSIRPCSIHLRRGSHPLGRRDS